MLDRLAALGAMIIEAHGGTIQVISQTGRTSARACPPMVLAGFQDPVDKAWISEMISTIVQTTLSVTHVSEVFEIAPDEFCRLLEHQLGKFDPGALDLTNRDPAAAEAQMREMESPHGLMLFDKLDHGIPFALGGEPRLSIRYHIGNPLVAWRMTRLDMRAALYAPLTLLVHGNGDPLTRVEYDLPSSLFGRFDGAIGTVGKSLDEMLRTIFSAIASQETP